MDSEGKRLTELKQIFLAATPKQSLHTTESEDLAATAKKQVEQLLQQLQEGRCPQDNSPEMTTDQMLNGLCCKDFPQLHCA